MGILEYGPGYAWNKTPVVLNVGDSIQVFGNFYFVYE